MNVQKRRQTKQRKAQKAARQKTRKKQKDSLKDVAKSAATTLLIWALVIFNLFIIASFVSKFWHAPGGNEVAYTQDREIQNQSQREQQPVRKIQVEVLNGCGVPGIAKSITQFLRDKGFDVVKVDNYESFNISETTIIDRRSLDKINAIEVAKILGVPTDKGVAPFLNPDLLLDVSIIIGHDYKKLVPLKNH